jgi:hypothetical protein
MERRLKRNLVVTVTGLAIAAGAGGAFAATQGTADKERKAFLNDAAKRLNVPPQRLSKALKDAFSARLDAAVAAGRISKAQADRIKARIRQDGGLPFFGGGPGRGGPGFGGPDRGGRDFGGPGRGGPLFGGLDAAASYLDLTPAQLRDRLESGKTLAQIAQDQSKSVDGLKSAIKEGVKAKLDAAVSDKRLTQAEEDRILSDLDSRLDDIVNRTGNCPHGGGGGPPSGGDTNPGAAPAMPPAGSTV